MAASVAAAAAADPGAIGGAPMPTTDAPLTAAEGMGLVQPMFTSGRAYWQVISVFWIAATCVCACVEVDKAIGTG